MKILGVGLSRTGTTSLADALQILGYNSITYAPERLADVLLGKKANPSFNRYDDVDAVTDLPAAFFYRELIEAYPHAKLILTIRDLDSWWQSISSFFSYKHKLIPSIDEMTFQASVESVTCTIKMPMAYHVRCLAYGSHHPNEYVYKKKYIEHNNRILKEISKEELLLLNICAGDGWEKLCTFLNKPIPNVPFPHKNSLLDK